VDPNETKKEGQSLVVLTPASAEEAGRIIDGVFAVEPDQSLLQIEGFFQNSLPQMPPERRSELQPLLEALWSYFKGIELLRQGNFSETSGNFQEASKVFDHLGFYDLRDLSVGMGAYVTAVVMLQQLNVGQAMEYFAKVKSYLENAGKFRSRFQSMIDHMEPEALVTSGVQALMTLDLVNGKILLDKAAMASEKVAQKYYANDVQMANTFNGLAQYYRAIYVMVESLTQFNQFAFDRFQEKTNLTATAKSACDLLRKADLGNQNLKNVLTMAQGVEEMLESIQELAALMQKVFGAAFKTDLKALQNIRLNYEKARDHFSQAGPAAVALVRYCDQLSTQVNNLERLARPKKKDFGIFSGVISCVLFLPIFLLASWAKDRFGIELSGDSLLWTCVGLALIGGFGFGALKFKSFFSSAPAEKAGVSPGTTTD
jgi:tetratricopeptide (TPR) repeat protein